MTVATELLADESGPAAAIGIIAAPPLQAAADDAARAVLEALGDREVPRPAQVAIATAIVYLTVARGGDLRYRTAAAILAEKSTVPLGIRVAIAARVGQDVADAVLAELESVGDAVWRSLGDRPIPEPAAAGLINAITLIAQAPFPEIAADTCSPISQEGPTPC